MEFFGLVAFILAMFNIGMSDKVKKLAFRMKKLEKRNKIQGEYSMSKMIKDLVGSQCTLIFENGVSVVCDILDVDDEWVKISQPNKKGKVDVRIIRIDIINELRLLG